ncbi:hypothetical protein [Streptomyces sp. NPDC059651]|uniref:hypothetical protein n=1 Tax=Streptomyces sp. NPDC059651 TaxID=3346897 RepID=UPI00369893D3
MNPTYARASGPHVAERERPAPGSRRDRELAELAADSNSGWHLEADPNAVEPLPEVKRPAKSASKADWVAYAISQGASEKDATTATRDELAAAYVDDEGGEG